MLGTSGTQTHRSSLPLSKSTWHDTCTDIKNQENKPDLSSSDGDYMQLRVMHTSRQQTMYHQMTNEVQVLCSRPTYCNCIKSTKEIINSPIRPIFIPARARALRADWAPGPGVLVLLPPVARNLMCKAVIPSSYPNKRGSKINQGKSEAKHDYWYIHC